MGKTASCRDRDPLRPVITPLFQLINIEFGKSVGRDRIGSGIHYHRLYQK